MWAGLWLKKVLKGKARGDWDCLAHSPHLPSSTPLGLELAQTHHCPGVSGGSHSLQAWLRPTSAYMTIRLCQVRQAQAIAPPCGSRVGVRPNSQGPGEARAQTLRPGQQEGQPHQGPCRGCRRRGRPTPLSANRKGPALVPSVGCERLLCGDAEKLLE
uniref:Uncharacterized protein n=1 Tax=Molossus molossus TaxID=27622 RepID=A0A7J8E312_MOLMO|nr:hypothetical protein HJG59_009017 [Molossus molossus]